MARPDGAGGGLLAARFRRLKRLWGTIMSNGRRLRLAVAVVGLVAAIACVEDTPALFIVHNAALDTSCRPSESTTGTSLGRGAMDLTVANRYIMNPLVENLMSPSGTVSLGGTTRGSGAGDYEGNRVTFSFAQVSFDAPPGFDRALPKNLEIPISGTLEPGRFGVVELEVINQALGEQLRTSTQLDDRNESVPVEVTLRFHGVTTSGTEVESNEFTYPLEICRGCLLEFPPEASDPFDAQPNCRAILSETETASSIDLGCHPGQDELLDCRVCRILVAAEGASEEEIERQCEPVPSR